MVRVLRGGKGRATKKKRTFFEDRKKNPNNVTTKLDGKALVARPLIKKSSFCGFKVKNICGYGVLGIKFG